MLASFLLVVAQRENAMHAVSAFSIALTGELMCGVGAGYVLPDGTEASPLFSAMKLARDPRKVTASDGQVVKQAVDLILSADVVDLHEVSTLDELTGSPLGVALAMVYDDDAVGIQLAIALLSRADVDVNTNLTWPGGSMLKDGPRNRASPLFMALLSVENDKKLGYPYPKGDGLKVARALLSRADVDVNSGGFGNEGESKHVTPLGMALTIGGKAGVELTHALISRVDLNASISDTFPDGGMVSPLATALQSVLEGRESAAEICLELLSRDDLYVNVGVVMPGGFTASPLYMALSLVRDGIEGGIELARALLARADVDVRLGVSGPDGVKQSPLDVALEAVEKGRNGAGALVDTLRERGAELGLPPERDEL